MGIFKRNYFELTKEEEAVFQRYGELDSKTTSIKRNDVLESHFAMLELVRESPSLLNLTSLFPNNYLNEVDLEVNNAVYKFKLEKFIELIESNPGEREILNFIRDNEAHFIIASVLQNHTLYGHHDRYLFQEFPLPPNFQADFLIIGKNSMGFNFLFVELEKPTEKITLKNGAFGDTIRKGIEQINDWKHWLEKNFSSLTNVFNKYKNPKENLPPEFYEYDSTRIEYLVIAGRRKDFNEKTYRLRRESGINGIKILHYDNIIDESARLLRTCSY